MSGQPTPKAIVLRALPVWIGLVLLLALTGFLAYLPLGAWNPAAAFGIAGTQAALVAILFMRLDTASALVRLTAACGVFWLAILFTLALADVLSRLSNS